MSILRALGGRLAHLLARLKYSGPARRLRAGRASRRDRAFDAYFGGLPRTLGGPPLRFRLTGRERLTREEKGRATHALRLAAEEGAPVFEPGDLLLVNWENREETVAEIRALLGAPPAREFTVWGHGTALCPARRRRVPADELLRRVLDLERASPALAAAAERLGALPAEAGRKTVNAGADWRLASLLRACPALADWRTLIRLQGRIVPRIYTIARLPGAGGDEGLELLVSPAAPAYRGEEGAGEGRCSGWLTRAPEGAMIEGWRLPHPHRLPMAHGHAGPGLIVVTGSAIAGALAFLHAGLAPRRLWLAWGVRSREGHAYYLDKLAAWRASGLLARCDIIESAPSGDGTAGRHVQDFLEAEARELAGWLGEAGAWIYVSGQKRMARAARESLRRVFAAGGLAADEAEAGRMLDRWSDELRLIESSSG